MAANQENKQDGKSGHGLRHYCVKWLENPQHEELYTNYTQELYTNL